MNEYIVIIISCCHDAEDDFVEKYFNNITEDWNYIVTNGRDYKKDELLDSFNFVLINQCKWGDSDVSKLISKIQRKNKKNIIWSHRGIGNDCKPILKDNIINMLNLHIFADFSHGENSAAESFLEALKNNSATYKQKFDFLISESIKKNHLIAISILCQGYLAAHGVDGFKVEGFQEIVKKNKGMTETTGWWKPALEENLNGEKLIEELKAIDKDDEFMRLNGSEDNVIRCLIIYTKDKLTELVIKINTFVNDKILSSKN